MPRSSVKSKSSSKRQTTWVYVGPLKAKNVFQLKVTIKDSRPPVWRRLLVRDDISLDELHDAIQLSFGWSNSHLHEFEVAGTRYMPEFENGPDWLTEKDAENERGVMLSNLGLPAKSEFAYIYDMGDDWHHTIRVEKILGTEGAELMMAEALGKKLSGSSRTPVSICVAGERSGPLDDCGGVWGWAELCAILADPMHPEHAERKEWAEEWANNAKTPFDPEQFDRLSINRGMIRYLKR